MNSTIIVTSADSKFFELVQGTILSIREKPQGNSVDIGFFDVGCTPEQLRWIRQYVDYIVEPDWNYNVPDVINNLGTSKRWSLDLFCLNISQVMKFTFGLMQMLGCKTGLRLIFLS